MVRSRGLVSLFAGIVVSVLPAESAHARDLADNITLLFGERGVEASVDRTATMVNHRAHFTSQSLATFSLLVEQLSVQAADFPAISTVPGFTWEFDPNLEVFEPSSGPLGPIYVERSQTLGAGKLSFGFSYLYVDFDELEGQDLDKLSFPGLTHNDCCSGTAPPPSEGVPDFEQDTADVFFEKLQLRSHVFTLTATYGVTEWLDVNVLLPIVHTTLNLRARSVLNDESGTDTHFFENDPEQRELTRVVDEEATGVGDLRLRTKARIFEQDGRSLGGGLSLRVPTGNEDDFQGLGDVVLSPFIVAALEHGILDVHASGGIDVNFDDSDRSRARYAGGFSVQVIPQVALLADVIGSSSLKTDRVSVTVPTFQNSMTSFEATPTRLPPTLTLSKGVSTDVIDFVPGVKVMLPGSVVAFAAVFIPVNDDGLRAEFIPAAGLQGNF